jgi:hypothetical protein
MTLTTEPAGGRDQRSRAAAEPARVPAGPEPRAAIGQRVPLADGAMGSMLQGSQATLDGFAGHEGCNEIPN